MNNKLKICFLSSYIPRECGIATYTDNLMRAVKKAVPSANFSVVAMDEGTGTKYPPIVKYKINQNNIKDYIEAAEYINKSDCDIVSIQHEFGIFGGFNGSNILHFLKKLEKPVVITFHTVSIVQKNPYNIVAKKYKSRGELVEKISRYVEGITVMTETAKKYLSTNFAIPSKKIYVLPHGAHVFSKKETERFRNEKGRISINKDDFIITSFGLIFPKKGLEYVIKAIPKIVRDFPNKKIKYLILGKAHPRCPKSYMISLKNLVKKLQLEEKVIFNSKYLEYEEIYRYLANTDIYITPYYSKEQASSGTLSYAIACGCPVVSTPYIFAQDMINRYEVGELVDFKDSKSIVSVINKLIKNPKLLSLYRKNSQKYGQSLEWSKIGRKFYNILQHRLK